MSTTSPKEYHSMTNWFQGLDQLSAKAAYPLSEWNPKDCGDIDIFIDDNGQWFHDKSPVARPALKALFAKLLWREGDHYYIKTPVEKMKIRVADAPFVATSMQGDEHGLWVTTNFQDRVLVNAQNPILLGPENKGFIAYIAIRDGLEARFTRALCHELANMLVMDDCDTGRLFVRSGGELVPLEPRA